MGKNMDFCLGNLLWTLFWLCQENNRITFNSNTGLSRLQHVTYCTLVWHVSIMWNQLLLKAHAMLTKFLWLCQRSKFYPSNFQVCRSGNLRYNQTCHKVLDIHRQCRLSVKQIIVMGRIKNSTIFVYHKVWITWWDQRLKRGQSEIKFKRLTVFFFSDVL